MPASMISAPTGGSPKVTGSSMVMVAMGPMPGSTPISVPTRQPMKQSPRLWRVKATENPSSRFATSVLNAQPSQDHPSRNHEDGNGQVEERAKQRDAPRRHRDREHRQLPPARLGRGRARDQDRRGASHRQPGRPDGHGEG